MVDLGLELRVGEAVRGLAGGSVQPFAGNAVDVSTYDPPFTWLRRDRHLRRGLS